MDQGFEPITYLEKELMFQNKTENKQSTIAKCKLSLLAPNQLSLEVHQNRKVNYNYIQSVSTGQYDNILCVTSQNGISYLFFENREDRDEWYSTIKQLQHGQVPSFPRKRETLPTHLDSTTKVRDRQKQPASSPSTLQQMFKKQLESELGHILKEPQQNIGSGKYVNVDYNQALQDSRDSYRMLNVLHGIQTVQVSPKQPAASRPTEDNFYDIPADGDPELIEDEIYEVLADEDEGDEDQIYDCPFEGEEEEEIYDDTGVGDDSLAGGIWSPGGRPQAPAGAGGGARGGCMNPTHAAVPLNLPSHADAPPIPRRPEFGSRSQNIEESDEIYEIVECDAPPPIPARPHSVKKNDQTPKEKTPKGKKEAKPPLIKRRTEPITNISDDASGSNRSSFQLPSGTSLSEELAKRVSERARCMTLPNSKDKHGGSDTLPRLPGKQHDQESTGNSSKVEKVRRVSQGSMPVSGFICDELSSKLQMRKNALSGKEFQVDGQTLDDRGGSVPSDDKFGDTSPPPWKQPQQQDARVPKTQPIPKKKPAIPPPTNAKSVKSPSRKNTEQVSKNRIPIPPPKPTPKIPPKPSTKPAIVQPDEIYDNTGPPEVAPKPQINKPSSAQNRLEVDVRIPRQSILNITSSLVLIEKDGHVVVERTDLEDHLHFGDYILRIGDIDVRNSSALFVTECLKRVSENYIRIRVLR